MQKGMEQVGVVSSVEEFACGGKKPVEGPGRGDEVSLRLGTVIRRAGGLSLRRIIWSLAPGVGR